MRRAVGEGGWWCVERVVALESVFVVQHWVWLCMLHCGAVVVAVMLLLLLLLLLLSLVRLGRQREIGALH